MPFWLKQANDILVLFVHTSLPMNKHRNRCFCPWIYSSFTPWTLPLPTLSPWPCTYTVKSWQTERHSSADLSSWGNGSGCSSLGLVLNNILRFNIANISYEPRCVLVHQDIHHTIVNISFIKTFSVRAHFVSTSKFCSLHNPSVLTRHKANKVFYSFQLLMLQSFRHCGGEGTCEIAHMGIPTVTQ